MSLVARTPDIDWIALDKGQRTVNETVNMLMLTMEEYINYGLSVLAEKLKEDEGYFYNKNSFLDIFKLRIKSAMTARGEDVVIKCE